MNFATPRYSKPRRRIPCDLCHARIVVGYFKRHRLACERKHTRIQQLGHDLVDVGSLIVKTGEERRFCD